MKQLLNIRCVWITILLYSAEFSNARTHWMAYNKPESFSNYNSQQSPSWFPITVTKVPYANRSFNDSSSITTSIFNKKDLGASTNSKTKEVNQTLALNSNITAAIEANNRARSRKLLKDINSDTRKDSKGINSKHRHQPSLKLLKVNTTNVKTSTKKIRDKKIDYSHPVGLRLRETKPLRINRFPSKIVYFDTQELNCYEYKDERRPDDYYESEEVDIADDGSNSLEGSKPEVKKENLTEKATSDLNGGRHDYEKDGHGSVNDVEVNNNDNLSTEDIAHNTNTSVNYNTTLAPTTKVVENVLQTTSEAISTIVPDTNSGNISTNMTPHSGFIGYGPSHNNDISFTYSPTQYASNDYVPPLYPWY